MKKGKITQAAFDRFVYRPLSGTSVLGRDVVYGADGAALPVVENDSGIQTEICTRTGTIGAELEPHLPGIFSAAREGLLARGARMQSAALSVTLPENFEEKAIRRISEEAGAWCKDHACSLAGAEVRISDAAVRPIVTVTAIGIRCEKDRADTSISAGSGDLHLPLVMIGEAGTAGAAILAAAYEERLRERFPAPIVESALAGAPELPAEPIITSRCLAAHGVTDGGVFGGLWELLEREGLGCEIDLQQIPIRQETIEVCEILDLNPYQLYSQGTMLVITGDPDTLLEQLQQCSIHACQIGSVNRGRDRIIRNGEDIRYLDKPRTDELVRMAERMTI